MKTFVPVQNTLCSSPNFNLPRMALPNQSLDASARHLLRAIALLFALLAWLQTAPFAYGQDFEYQRAKSFLDNRDNANTILQFVHFGADYHGHQFLRVTDVQDGEGNIIPGQVAFIYRFMWEDDGVTDMAFFVNGSGRIVGDSIVTDNGELSKPFAFADLSIQLLGRLIINSDDKMSRSDKDLALKLIDSADSKGLLAFWLGSSGGQ